MGFRYGLWRPLGLQSERRMSAHGVVCLHTAVGTLAGTDAMFRAAGYGGTESHFGVGFDGRTLQWQDTDHVADANFEGSYRIISIETADWGEGPFGRWDTDNSALVPAWTGAQIEAMAQICVLAHRTYGIPLELIPDSRPGRRGIGYHRQGCDPWRVAGGERWSKARGKICPGERRIAQVPAVIARARAIAAHTARPPAPPPLEEDDVMHPILLTYYDDEGNPDPAGLDFAGAANVEQGRNAIGHARGWLRWGTFGESATWSIVWWGATAELGRVANPHLTDNAEAPAGCRGVRISGRRAHDGVQPAASLITYQLP